MSEPLAIYLQDHLAGARFAVQLLKNLRDQHSDEPLGDFAAALLDEVLDDFSILEQTLERVNHRHTASGKYILARLSEQLTRMKLHRRTRDGLGTLQKLETLALGIQGKLALWEALAEIAGPDARLRDVDFGRLISRAKSQHARVEECRMETVRSTLGKMPSSQ